MRRLVRRVQRPPERPRTPTPISTALRCRRPRVRDGDPLIRPTSYCTPPTVPAEDSYQVAKRPRVEDSEPGQATPAALARSPACRLAEHAIRGNDSRRETVGTREATLSPTKVVGHVLQHPRPVRRHLRSDRPTVLAAPCRPSQRAAQVARRTARTMRRLARNRPRSTKPFGLYLEPVSNEPEYRQSSSVPVEREPVAVCRTA